MATRMPLVAACLKAGEEVSATWGHGSIPTWGSSGLACTALPRSLESPVFFRNHKGCETLPLALVPKARGQLGGLVSAAWNEPHPGPRVAEGIPAAPSSSGPGPPTQGPTETPPWLSLSGRTKADFPGGAAGPSHPRSAPSPGSAHAPRPHPAGGRLQRARPVPHTHQGRKVKVWQLVPFGFLFLMPWESPVHVSRSSSCNSTQTSPPPGGPIPARSRAQRSRGQQTSPRPHLPWRGPALLPCMGWHPSLLSSTSATYPGPSTPKQRLLRSVQEYWCYLATGRGPPAPGCPKEASVTCPVPRQAQHSLGFNAQST